VDHRTDITVTDLEGETTERITFQAYQIGEDMSSTTARMTSRHGDYDILGSVGFIDYILKLTTRMNEGEPQHTKEIDENTRLYTTRRKGRIREYDEEQKARPLLRHVNYGKSRGEYRRPPGKTAETMFSVQAYGQRTQDKEGNAKAIWEIATTMRSLGIKVLVQTSQDVIRSLS